MVDVIPIIPFVNLACLLSQPSDNNTKPQASRQVPRIRTRPAPCTLDLRDERITFPLTPPPSLLSSRSEHTHRKNLRLVTCESFTKWEKAKADDSKANLKDVRCGGRSAGPESCRTATENQRHKLILVRLNHCTHDVLLVPKGSNFDRSNYNFTVPRWYVVASMTQSSESSWLGSSDSDSGSDSSSPIRTLSSAISRRAAENKDFIRKQLWRIHQWSNDIQKRREH